MTAREEAEKALAEFDEISEFYGGRIQRLADALRALLSVPETENWEYGTVYEVDPTEPDFVAFPSRERAEAVVAESPTDTGLVRRHPAVPASDWEPVPVEEDNRA